MNKRKRRGYRRSICTVCLFIVIVAFSGVYGCTNYVQRQTHTQNSQRMYLQVSRTMMSMQDIERKLVQRRVQYLAGLLKMQNRANVLLELFQQQEVAWGKTHRYHDFYDGSTYKLDYEYGPGNGAIADSTAAVKQAHTVNDYQAAIKLTTTNFTHLYAMETDYADKTPWDYPHTTDQWLMHYHHLSGQVIVVSYIEQVCRVYQDGKLVRAFLITSGRFGDPSPVGVSRISRRRWHTVFKSHVPVGSVNWYPDTPIHYAMEYRTGGYYLHDSWWRTYYGPGTNFPHYDPAGEEFSGSGSHGCVNLSLIDAAWLYTHTTYGTPVVAY